MDPRGGGRTSPSPSPHRRVVAVLGFRGVGKSAFTIRFVEKRFCEDYQPTIESTFNTSISSKRGTVVLDIIDTAGMDEISVINPRLIQAAHGYVLVFSVTDRGSFDMIKKISERLLVLSGDNHVPRVLVGTKCDLPNRQVSREEGENFAKSLGIDFVETSALSGMGIDPVIPGPSAFAKLIERIDAHGEDEVEESVGACDCCDWCLCFQGEGDDTRTYQPSESLDSGAGRCMSYLAAVLTFLMGVCFLVIALIVDTTVTFSALQQGVLIALGILTLIMGVVAIVGVQKLSRTINKLHLGYVVVAALGSAAGAIVDLVSNPSTRERDLAVAVLCMVPLLELPIIGITSYHVQKLRDSFHENNYSESLNTADATPRHRVYPINSSRYDTVHWH